MFRTILLSVLGTAGVVLLAIVISWRWEAKHEEITPEWGENELPTMILETHMDDTGPIDMSWMMVHGDMGDVEERFHKELTTVIDEAIFVLLDDTEWARFGDYLKERQECVNA